MIELVIAKVWPEQRSSAIGIRTSKEGSCSGSTLSALAAPVRPESRFKEDLAAFHTGDRHDVQNLRNQRPQSIVFVYP